MNEQTSYVLAGDVGGTKTVVGLFSVQAAEAAASREPGVPEPVIIERFENASYPGLPEVLAEFLKKNPTPTISGASFGVAAVIEDNRARLTNIDWTIDARDISSRFKIPKVTLINDLEATGWVLDALSPSDVEVVQKGTPSPGNVAVIAAGTGLGEVILFRHNGLLVPSPSEGGHTDFGPRTVLEAALLEYLTQRFGHVSYERILSGQGLRNIFDFLLAHTGRREPRSIIERFKTEDPPAVISDEALRGGDETCYEALELFVSIYGAEAGNLALKALAVGGVYVGGGIAPKIISAINSGAFIDAFIDKGRFRELMQRIPVHVITNPDGALLGAARHAALGVIE